MAKRDPNKTARNKAIAKMSEELRSILPAAIAEIHKSDEASLNAFIGHKADLFLDLKNDVIKSPEEYVSKWLEGMTRLVQNGTVGAVKMIHDYLADKSNVNFRRYCEIFLKRSFLRHYDELSKTRPREGEASYWFGLNNAYYGLFVTPRFNPANNDWENDRSEIRAFTETYWSIGHVLKTGLCYQGEDRMRTFASVDDYLQFFYDQVRLTNSQYQVAVAQLYIDYVRQSATPDKVPLLIPEMRFANHATRHQHRLDFLVINPYTMDKIGFELSPWSSHGQLSGKTKTLKELNKEALENFEKEVSKMKSYFKRFNIFTMIYTDSDLSDIGLVFEDIRKYLNPAEPPVQLSLNLIDDYFGIK